VDGYCVSIFPKDPQCSSIAEPVDLLNSRLAGPDAPLVIGSIYSLGELKDQVLTESVRLAVNEINGNGGELNRGKGLGVVVCDNGGPGNKAQGAERTALTNKAVDYLAGTLGVPYIVGPLSSADSLQVIARLKEKNYPTVVISASSTSPSLTEADDPLGNGQPGLFWRTCPSDVLQGQVMAADVVGVDAMVNKVAVIYSNDAYGQGLSAVFRDQYLGGTANIFPVNDDQFAKPDAIAKLVNDVNGYGPNGVLVITVRAGNTLTIVKALADTPAGNAKFYFTDGAKDAAAMFDQSLPAKVQSIIAASQGTAPASPSGDVYDTFLANFNAKWQRNAADFSFTAHAYDATYIGAFGVVYASRQNDDYDGNQVIEGMLKLSSGMPVDIKFSTFSAAKTSLVDGMSLDIRGASGLLQFNPDTGEAPGNIEIWTASGGKFTTKDVVMPP
jgi:ABC-type branched-subunit amino acid transport system substrate-binding protein